MVDKRKGLHLSKFDIEVEVSRDMIENPNGIYMISYKIEYGREGDFAFGYTVYCYNQHDLGIDMIIAENGLQNKRIKKIELSSRKQVGDSVAKTSLIKKWRITNAKNNK